MGWGVLQEMSRLRLTSGDSDPPEFVTCTEYFRHHLADLHTNQLESDLET